MERTRQGQVCLHGTHERERGGMITALLPLGSNRSAVDVHANPADWRILLRCDAETSQTSFAAAHHEERPAEEEVNTGTLSSPPYLSRLEIRTPFCTPSTARRAISPRSRSRFVDRPAACHHLSLSPPRCIRPCYISSLTFLRPNWSSTVKNYRVSLRLSRGCRPRSVAIFSIRRTSFDCRSLPRSRTLGFVRCPARRSAVYSTRSTFSTAAPGRSTRTCSTCSSICFDAEAAGNSPCPSRSKRRTSKSHFPWKR